MHDRNDRMHDRMQAISGMRQVSTVKGSPMEHDPHHTAHGAPLSESEFREFLKEEQKEGEHPILKGKHF
jgi:hypothetical protein